MTNGEAARIEPPISPSSRSHILIAIGVLLFSAGALLPLVFGENAWLVSLRWSGLVTLGSAVVSKKSLTYWILFAMVLGGEIGLDRPGLAEHLRILSDIFLRLIKVIVAPLILGSLVTGVAGHGDLRSLRRVALKTLVYFELVTTLALFIGVAVINISHAGEGLAMSGSATPSTAQPTTQIRWDDFLVHIFPENLAKSIAEDQILQVAVFAMIFGLALARVPEAKRAPVLSFCESLTQTMFSFTNIVMYAAPVAVGAATAYTVGHMGTGALLPMGKLIAAAYVAFAVFLLGVLLPIALIARIPIRSFLNAITEPASIAFATSTSQAALPRAMENMETFGVTRRIVAFVFPLGYSFNMDGATLYLSLASIFVAQAAGIQLSWKAQLMMVLTLMLTTKGLAGVPRAMLVVLVATAATFHLPTEPIFLILGVDALIDMGRAALNVVGNCLACAVIARWEGGLSLPSQPLSSGFISE
jgi:proton glutamate symport protein